MSFYFNDIYKAADFDFINMLLDENSYENILIYDLLYKTLVGAKPWNSVFKKMGEFTRKYSGTK